MQYCNIIIAVLLYIYDNMTIKLSLGLIVFKSRRYDSAQWCKSRFHVVLMHGIYCYMTWAHKCA